jgi:MoxR-like ATPase
MGMVEKSLLKDVHALNALIHENAAQYHHSRPMTVLRTGIILPESQARHPFSIEYDIKDLFTIGAITQSSILMTGGTDTGKTTLAKLVMNALFGKEDTGWHRIDVDTDFGKDAYTDVDFSVITEGKKTSDGFFAGRVYLGMPGLIWDEINRTHAALANKLLHVFDKDISLPDGKRFKLGTPYADGKQYQFQIAAINEGREYAGTFDLDKALRRRTIIEIPMDVFPPTPHDRRAIQQAGKDIPLRNTASNLETVLRAYEGVGSSLKLHPTAELFVAYLESFDYCRNSLTGEKGGVASRSESIRHICSQPITMNGQQVQGGEVSCPYLKTFTNELCPYVRGITPGISKNLIAVARGFALLRGTKFVEMMAGYAAGSTGQALSYAIERPEQLARSLQEYTGTALTGKALAQAAADQYIRSLEVELGDIESAAGFVGYSKIGIAGAWTLKHYQGNKHEAVRRFVREARTKFEEGLARKELEGPTRLLAGEGSPEQWDGIRSYCLGLGQGIGQNPWLWRVLEPYAGRQREDGRAQVRDFYQG